MKGATVRSDRRHTTRNRGFDYKQFAAVLRPELLTLLPNRDRDEMLPFEREPSPLEIVDTLSKDSSR